MTYDHFGNYTVFLIAGTVGCALSGLLMISMPKFRCIDSSRMMY